MNDAMKESDLEATEAKDAIAESCSTAMSQLPRDDELPDLTDMTCPPVPGPEEVVGGQE